MPDCSPFWYTIDTMQALRGYDYHAFELFGPVHLFCSGWGCARPSAPAGSGFSAASARGRSAGSSPP